MILPIDEIHAGDCHTDNGIPREECQIDENLILELEAVSAMLNSCISLPLTCKGQPDIKRFTDWIAPGMADVSETQKLAAAAYQSYVYHAQNGVGESEEPDIPHPIDAFVNVADFRFTSAVTNLTTPEDFNKSRYSVDVMGLSGDLLNFLEHLTGEPGTSLYTPYIDEDGKQVVITEYVREVAEKIRRGHFNLVMDLVASVKPGQLCKGHLIPTHLPACVTPATCDISQTDVLSFTSFSPNEQVKVLGLYNNATWALVSSHKSAGWVSTDKLEFILNKSKSKTPEPTILTPSQMVEYLRTRPRVYMSSINDCSRQIKDTFAMMGFVLPPYSGDMCHALEIAGIPPTLVDSEEALTNLLGQNGLYITQLLQPQQPGEPTSRHIYLTGVNGRQITSYSQAYSIHGDTGMVESPYGPHLCNLEGMRFQITGNKRLLKMYKIAE